MIRPFQRPETPELLALWLASTIEAHPFIPEAWWRESLPVVRDTYLPNASTWVMEQQGALVGFISILDGQFIGALFVAPQHIGSGIGHALLEHAMQRYSRLSLEVYQKNIRAVNFYHAHGFRIEDSAWHQETRHPTWIMSWQAA
ncbi:N-acetyltransferase [Entomohabitans teleogrylli]|uniref:N-acetyltransferase n=1 Tax=Entomohabitans teleogrylli TaxID=1384589 RepID=UPI00073DAFCE|nr:N-acetyltransferase [Entomohabitans teleogrylli]